MSYESERILDAFTDLSVRVRRIETKETNTAIGVPAAPADASYVVMSLNATLVNERVLTVTAPIALADGGAGGNVTISHAVSGVGAGTYTKVTVDVLGHVTAGTTLSPTDFTHTLLDGAAHTDTVVQVPTRGSLVYGNSTPLWDELPLGAVYTHLESDGTDVAWQANLNIADDAFLYFGNDQDVLMTYDEAADDIFKVTGADWLINGPVVNVGTAVGGGGELLALRVDQNANTSMEIVNANGGAGAAAALRIKNVAGAGAGDSMAIGITGTAWTPLGALDLADMGVVQANVNLAGGLLIRTMAATPLVLAVNVDDEKMRLDANGATIPDDVYLNFGAGLDTRIRYDEAGDNRTEIEGADWYFDTVDVTLYSAVSAHPVLEIENTNADSQAPVIEFYKNSASPAASDDLGAFDFYGETDTGAKDRYAYWLAESLDVTNGATGGGMRFMVTMAGTDRFLLSLLGFSGVADQGEVIINEAGQDVDFIVESDNQTHMLFVDGGADVLGVRSSNPAAVAEGLYVPWITGDGDATARFGSTNAANNQNAIEAFTDSGYGVLAYSADTAGVQGSTVTGLGVEGVATGAGTGVYAKSATGYGLVANLTGAGTAIASFNDNGVSALTIQDGGQSDFTEYIRHLGDTDTYLRFQTDQATLVCGGVTMIDAVEAASDYLNLFPSSSGRVGIGLSGYALGTLDVQQDSGVFSLIIGADITARSRTDATRKFARLGIPHYTNAEEPVAMIVGDSNGTSNIVRVGGGTISGNAATTVGIYTAANDTTTTGTERLRVTSAGYLGVATTAPDYTLDVAGTVGVDSYIYHNGDADTYMFFEADRWRLFTGAVQMIEAYETTVDYLNFHAGQVGINESVNTFGTINLAINQSTNDDEILSLKSSDVAHGITSITETDTYGHFKKVSSSSGGLLMRGFTETYIGARIDGAGVTDDTTKATNAIGYIELRARKKTSTTFGAAGADANLVVIGNDTTTRFIFDAEGTGHADVAWTTFSDRRLKSDIVPISYGLNEVLALEPVSYQRNGRSMIGLVAQDVYKVVPEATRKPPTDKSYWGLDSNALVPVLVRAVQELKAEIEELRRDD